MNKINFWTMSNADAIRHQLGGVFEDRENTYFACGKDWWNILYAPKYPEKTAGDLIAYGSVAHHDFVLMDNPPAGHIATMYKFNTFGDLCDFINRGKEEA